MYLRQYEIVCVMWTILKLCTNKVLGKVLEMVRHKPSHVPREVSWIKDMNNDFKLYTGPFVRNKDWPGVSGGGFLEACTNIACLVSAQATMWKLGVSALGAGIICC